MTEHRRVSTGNDVGYNASGTESLRLAHGVCRYAAARQDGSQRGTTRERVEFGSRGRDAESEDVVRNFEFGVIPCDLPKTDQAATRTMFDFLPRDFVQGMVEADSKASGISKK